MHHEVELSLKDSMGAIFVDCKFSIGGNLMGTKKGKKEAKEGNDSPCQGRYALASSGENTVIGNGQGSPGWRRRTVPKSGSWLSLSSALQYERTLSGHLQSTGISFS